MTMFTLRLWIGVYKLRWWVWKNRVRDAILGQRRNYVIAVRSGWLEMIADDDKFSYRAVTICNKRSRWPFQRTVLSGFQLEDEEATPLIAANINDVLAVRRRIRNLVEKYNHRRMQKAAFGIK